jgi:hypothetical protein
MKDLGSRLAQAKKFVGPHLRKKLGMMACACQHSDYRKHKIRGSWSRLAWAKKQDPIFKITKAKRA